jgi:hypothetical protein
MRGDAAAASAPVGQCKGERARGLAAIMSLVDFIQWLAFAVGTVGTLLWACRGPWSKYAAAFWIAASLLWIWFDRLSGLAGPAARDLVSIFITLWGAWRWLPGRRVAVRKPTGIAAIDRLFMQRKTP